MTKLAPVLSAHWDEKDSFTLEGYKRHGGYKAAEKALAMDPDAVIQLVKDSGLRGRGGAGFPTGMKWGFIPQGDNKDHYLVVNADESEPGTCKDTPLLMANPHVLIEGCIIACHAIRAKNAFIYIRGEITHVARRVNQAIADAYAAGILGNGIDVVLHVGAGAYICGEETALLDSLEGFRGQPRLRPPFPAIAGLYARPTVVNNVEAIASVPAIVMNGAEWYQSMGTEKSKGTTLYSLSGHVANPGQFEAPLGITLREILDLAGGVRAGHKLKFWTPGGSSTPLFTDAHLDVPLDYEGVAAAGRCLEQRRFRFLMKQLVLFAQYFVGLSSTSTSHVESAHLAAKVHGGWYRFCVILKMERELKQILPNCWIFATTSWAVHFVHLVMEQQVQSHLQLSISVMSTSHTLQMVLAHLILLHQLYLLGQVHK